MRIIIAYTHKKFIFDVSGYTKVIELKKQLSSKICEDYHAFELIYGAKIMKDNRSLDTYEIEDGDTIIASQIYEGAGPPIVNSTYSSNINCMDKRGKNGEYYGYYIKGSNEGTVWGDGIYTDDSNIAKAAVLEGKCQIGEEKLVVIKIIEGKSLYGTCTKNGINSCSWGNWDGSYIFD